MRSLWRINGRMYAGDAKVNRKTSVLLDIAGKIWAAPATAIGIAAGTVLTGISIITGKDGSIEFANNAITFTTGLNFNGSITLGNSIIHAGGDVRKWNKESNALRYNGTGYVNLGKHEEAHTYQYQKYGIFTIPVITGSAIINGGIGEDNFRDFMGHSKLENAADDYAEGLKGRSD